jgi:hypothetical protein
LAAARPAMPAPTIITWQKFMRSRTDVLGIQQLEKFRYTFLEVIYTVENSK